MSVTISDSPGTSWMSPAPRGARRARPVLEVCSHSLSAEMPCRTSPHMIPPIQVSWGKPSGSNMNQYSQGKTCICVASWQGISCCLTCLVPTTSPGRKPCILPHYSWNSNCCLTSSWMVLYRITRVLIIYFIANVIKSSIFISSCKEGPQICKKFHCPSPNISLFCPLILLNILH